jgi:hypothetical protein
MTERGNTVLRNQRFRKPSKSRASEIADVGLRAAAAGVEAIELEDGEGPLPLYHLPLLPSVVLLSPVSVGCLSHAGVCC